jgi:hypothetical protein
MTDVQRFGQFTKPYRLTAAGKNWCYCIVLLLLSAAFAARAGEPPVNETCYLTAVQEEQAQKNQKLEERDLLLFFHESMDSRNRSNTWFAVRADYYEFTFDDQFTRREGPTVAGLKAVFTF